jgi:hypothetical protein
MSDFPTLDLHGIKHKDVEDIVEEFVCMNDGMIRIITGHSPAMKSLVNNILTRYGLMSRPERLINEGSIIAY